MHKHRSPKNQALLSALFIQSNQLGSKSKSSKEWRAEWKEDAEEKRQKKKQGYEPVACARSCCCVLAMCLRHSSVCHGLSENSITVTLSAVVKDMRVAKNLLLQDHRNQKKNKKKQKNRKFKSI